MYINFVKLQQLHYMLMNIYAAYTVLWYPVFQHLHVFSWNYNNYN